MKPRKQKTPQVPDGNSGVEAESIRDMEGVEL